MRQPLLAVVACSSILLSSHAASALPFTGCSLYQPDIAADTAACPEVDIGPLASCWIPTVWPLPPIPGHLWSAHLPEWMIEVTNEANKSAFATLDAPTLKAQMLATPWMDAAAQVVPGLNTRAPDMVHTNYGTSTKLYFGRVIPTPYGPVGWSYPEALVFDVGTPAAPVCYEGLTEYAPQLWGDRPGSADSALAALWSPVTGPVCSLGGAAVTAVDISGIPIPPVDIPPATSCAVPLPTQVQFALSVMSPTAANPLSQCMNMLGGLYPRTGVIEADPYTAGQIAAWRTASLTEDIFRSSNVAVKPGDKWQMIWPPTVSSHRCFTPGGFDRPYASVPDVGTMSVRPPMYDLEGGPLLPNTEFVFVVWRQRQVCLTSPQAVAAAAEILTHQAIATAACAPINAVNKPW